MSSPVVVLAGSFLAVLGVFMVVRGLVADPGRAEARQQSGPGAVTRMRQHWGLLSRRWRLLVVAAGVAGLLAFALTGWVVMLVAVPAAVLGLPWLLGTPPQR